LRAQAIWSEALTDRDRDWVGRLTDVDAITDFTHVVSRRPVLVA